MNDNIVRIFIATDNHLGFCERDPVRHNDCFAAFEEVLLTAKEKKADFVLLAGDLFHENKPSRRTLHCAMELLRTNCCGSEPIYIEVLNDQQEIFKSSLGKVNYEDPFHSVGLPVFSIHGNHDDPSRDGSASKDALAALDLLAVSNLVNYFGKIQDLEEIEIVPVLLKKGSTKIALYGLGAIRDERLNRMWNQKKVKFVRLTEEQGRDEFFNIFVIHQNRDYGRGKKNCVHESMIPDWIDLVVWGNEHESQPQLHESLVGTYRILQPGSSIACSLSQGESNAHPKHMALIEVKERKFRLSTFRFRHVRSFIYDEISLQEILALKNNAAHPKIEEKIKEVLRAKVQEMITRARNETTQLEETRTQPDNNKQFRIIDPHKVLIRLRVDHDGFPAINHQRFGSQFSHEVANPNEIVLLAKKKKEVLRRVGNLGDGGEGGGALQEELRKMLASGDLEEIHRIRIEDLVTETLTNGNHSLSILREDDLAQALEDFIVRKTTNAIQDIVAGTLSRAQKLLMSDNTVKDKDKIIEASQRSKEELVKQRGNKDRNSINNMMAIPPADMDIHDEVDLGDDSDQPKAKKTATVRGRKATAATADAPAKTTKGRAKKAETTTTTSTAKRGSRAKAAVKYANSDEDDDEDIIAVDDDSEEAMDIDDDDDDIIEIDEDEAPSKKKKASSSSSSAATKAAAKKTAPVAKAKATTVAKKPAATKKATSKAAMLSDIEDDDEVQFIEATPAPASRGRNNNTNTIGTASAQRALLFEPSSQLTGTQSTVKKSRNLPASFGGASQPKKNSNWDD